VQEVASTDETRRAAASDFTDTRTALPRSPYIRMWANLSQG
jgi:hypothetical protein